MTRRVLPCTLLSLFKLGRPSLQKITPIESSFSPFKLSKHENTTEFMFYGLVKLNIEWPVLGPCHSFGGWILQYTIGLTEGELMSSMCYPARALKTKKRYSSTMMGEIWNLSLNPSYLWKLVSIVSLEYGTYVSLCLTVGLCVAYELFYFIVWLILRSFIMGSMGISSLYPWSSLSQWCQVK